MTKRRCNATPTKFIENPVLKPSVQSVRKGQHAIDQPKLAKSRDSGPFVRCRHPVRISGSSPFATKQRSLNPNSEEISFRLLYGLLIMGHGRRQILWFGVTAHPTAEWIANQLTEACGWEQIPSYLIRDRDGAYGEIFIRRVRSIGIRDRPTSPRSPWQNAYAERLIGSIRRECIDHIVIFGERHLRHVLLSYMDYYNRTRTHLSLNKDAPKSRAVEQVGHVVCRPVLGGLHHQYIRI